VTVTERLVVAADEDAPRVIALIVIDEADTAVTLPATTAPNPAPPGPPDRCVPVGAPDGRVTEAVPEAAPVGRAPPGPPAPPAPKPVEHDPLVAAETWMLVAVNAADGDDDFDALLATTHDPTVTAALVALPVIVKRVAAVKVTDVWVEVFCTCRVEPLTAAISPDAAAPRAVPAAAFPAAVPARPGAAPLEAAAFDAAALPLLEQAATVMALSAARTATVARGCGVRLRIIRCPSVLGC
jgi:hypothetical protein